MINKQSAKLIREQLKLTPQGMADLIGASRVTIYCYENGSKNIGYTYMKRIAKESGRDIIIRVSANGDSEAWIPES